MNTYHHPKSWLRDKHFISVVLMQHQEEQKQIRQRIQPHSDLRGRGAHMMIINLKGLALLNNVYI